MSFRITAKNADRSEPDSKLFQVGEPFEDRDEIADRLAAAAEEYPDPDYTVGAEELVISGDGEDATGKWKAVS